MITTPLLNRTTVLLAVFAFSSFFSTNALAGLGTENSAPSAIEPQPCSLDGKACLIAPDEPKSYLFRDGWTKTDDPGKDGWDTEVFNNIAGKQLKKIGKMLINPEYRDFKHAAELVNDAFVTNELRPEKARKVFEDDALLVVRPEQLSPEKSADSAVHFSGREGFLSVMKALAEPFKGAEDYRFKFKLFRVQKNSDYVITRQYFALSGLTDRGMREHNATWDIRWVRNGEGPPLISSIKVMASEEVVGKVGGDKLYQDVTEAVLQKNASFADQVLHGYQEYLSSIENTLEFNIFGTPGVAVGDVNGDRLDDLYVCQEQGLPNLLYVQNKDGSATDLSAQAGVNWLESSRSALFLDLDNDGDQDLIVAMPGAVILASNDGLGNFTIANSLPIADDPMSMAAADYDADGDLDIFVILYNPDRFLEEKQKQIRGSADSSFVYHDANNGPPNVLFRNDMEENTWTFTDITKDSGIDQNNNRFSLAASWEDYDNDGDQDLYVANDYGRDNLYRNDTPPGRAALFVDVADQASVEDSAGSMAVTWGDYNRDGFMDPFISAMWSSAGNRVTYQSKFKTDDPEVKKRLQRFAHGNTMLKNNGDGTFSDESEPSGTEMGRWAWSSNFVDINNDGWEDLVVANGFLTGDAKGGDL